MKNKKFYNLVIITSLLLICLVIIINLPKKENKKILFLGDFLFSNIQGENFDKRFCSPNLTTSALLRLVSNDAKKVEGNKTYQLSYQVNKSKQIILGIGMNDLINCFTYDQYLNTYKYDEKNVNLTLNIIYSDLSLIIDDLFIFKLDANIKLVNYYIPLYLDELSQEIFKTANKNLYILANMLNLDVIDISSIGGVDNLKAPNNFYLSELGYQNLFEIIKETI